MPFLPSTTPKLLPLPSALDSKAREETTPPGAITVHAANPQISRWGALSSASDGNSQSHAEALQVPRVSYPKSDSCVPSRCNSLSRRAACGVANGRCGGPGCHDLATSSPLDGTESGGCGSICGTLENRGANKRDASIQHSKTPSGTDSGKAAKHC